MIAAGLVTLMAVKAFGADAVAITDIKRDNLDLAMKLGADVALNPDRDAAPQEVATWMRAALPPNGPDIVIDCAGFEPTLQVNLWPWFLLLRLGLIFLLIVSVRVSILQTSPQLPRKVMTSMLESKCMRRLATLT